MKEYGPGWVVRYHCETIIGFKFFPDGENPNKAKKKALGFARDVKAEMMYHVDALVDFRTW